MDSILHRVAFVKAKTEDDFTCKPRKKDTRRKTTESEGKEAKEFYESLIERSDDDNRRNTAITSESNITIFPSAVAASSSGAGRSKDPSSKQCLDAKSNQELQISLEAQSVKTRAEVDLNARLRKGSSDFLRCAQEGDLNTLKRHLERSTDINGQDSYGWTAVMCAAHAGHVEVLQFLLENGANVYLADNQGKNVRGIAESVKPKNKEICKMIKDYIDGKSNWRAIEEEETPTYEIFYCENCKREFSDSTREKHLTSTIHLFNVKPKDRSTLYHLPESNKGFRLLLQSGWDKEKGLGPEGKGNKFPVKTVLKRDRMGLGNPSQSSAKITHFKPHDTEAVKKPKLVDDSIKERTLRKSTLSKRQRAKQLSKEQEKEMNFRLAFSTDN